MNSLIALTEIHRKNLLQHLPIRACAVHVLPNAVDLERFHPCKRDEQLRASLTQDARELLIGVVSRLDLGKGVMQVVQVADRLRQLGVRFKLILVGNETAGEEGAKAALDNEIARLDLRKQMQLVGHRTDIETVMASLDVLLMPSPTETFGRVLIEAMASGVAVVASGGGGVPNIVQHEQNGLLVPPLSVEAMAQSIAVYYKDPEKRVRLAEQGRQMASERYDYRVLDQRLYSILGLQ
jgi:glycosyltransferase involved in cell wall biosynthesis